MPCTGWRREHPTIMRVTLLRCLLVAACSYASPSGGYGASGGSYGPERGASRGPPRTDPYRR